MPWNFNIRSGGRSISSRGPKQRSLTINRWFYGDTLDADDTGFFEGKLRGFLREWAVQQRDLMQLYAPHRHGLLAKSFRYKVRRSEGGKGYSAQVYTTRPDVARWVNYGTGIYNEDPVYLGPRLRITPKRAKLLRWPGRPVRQGRGAWGGSLIGRITYNYAKSVAGQRATHFMDKAEAQGRRWWDGEKPRALRLLLEVLKEGFR
jgi:hypothetical protein